MILSNLLERFPSLSKPFQSAHLVGLYFASSWCPDCVEPTKILKSVHEASSSSAPCVIGSTEKQLLEIVYISSDNSEEQMKEAYGKTHGPWSYVEYDKFNTEIASLKQFFGACAFKESEALNMGQGRTYERKSGIPTLVVIRSDSMEVVTTSGAQDLSELGTDAWKKWKDALEQ